jgi:hypothetical protein
MLLIYVNLDEKNLEQNTLSESQINCANSFGSSYRK